VIEFKSFLANDIEDYLQFRKDVGFKSHKLRWFFSTLDRYLIEQQAEFKDLTPAFLLSFRQGIDADPGTVNKIFLLLKVFFAYLVRMEKMDRNPAADIPPL